MQTDVSDPTRGDVVDIASEEGVELRDGRAAADRLRDVIRETWRPFVVLAFVAFLWWLVTNREWVEPYLVPKPRDVAELMIEQRSFLWHHIWITSYETVAGFVLAVAIGQLAAMAIVYSVTIEKALYPILLFAQVVPKIAIAPLFVVWLGFGPAPKILIAALIACFPSVISSGAGLRSVDPEMLELAATMGASKFRTFRKIRFPTSLPHLFSGLKVAATLAVVGAVVGEFVCANAGLGYVLLIANGNLNGPLLFAGLILMTLIGIVMFVAIEVAERVVLPWHASRRGGDVAGMF
ncbi:ABC transporter permease [soil metagenome]